MRYTLNRRKFLKRASYFLSSLGVVTLGTHGWAVRGTWGQTQTSSRKRLIVFFLRGGVDGLNVVVPHQESRYYEARPTIAVPRPGEEGGVLDLDGQFGLHPALEELLPLWRDRKLAFVHASGSPSETRSHFEAQDYMENGTPGENRNNDGWMGRLLTILTEDASAQALSFSRQYPLILEGASSVITLPMGTDPTQRMPIDNQPIADAFDRLYNGNDPLSLAYQQGRAGRESVLADLSQEMIAASQGAPGPANFINDARRLSKLMTEDPSIQMAFMDIGNWDTHINQGSSTGRLADLLQPVGQGLVLLTQELGDLFADTTIVVMSEFGRTLLENGNRGTDHGHGNVMWVLGGSIPGGQMYGKWLGLEESQLHDGRDLPVTTDFRDVIAAVLTRHMEMAPATTAQVFPDYSFNTDLEIL